MERINFSVGAYFYYKIILIFWTSWECSGSIVVGNLYVYKWKEKEKCMVGLVIRYAGMGEIDNYLEDAICEM